MKVFVVDSQNTVHVFPSRKAARQQREGIHFESQAALTVVAKEWSASRLVALWNKLPRVESVSRFRNRQTAVRRIWAQLQALPPAKPKKSDLIIGLLMQPAGATVTQIAAATGWRAHSVRAFLSAQLGKRLGVRVTSTKEEGGRVYRIR